MDKLLINLYVPAVGESYDLFAPEDLEIGTLATLLANSVHELDNGRYGPSGQEMLIRRAPEQLLHPRRTLQDYNIRDGAQLILL